MIDSLYISQWWLTIFLGGTIFLPLTFILFRNFKDKGYIFSKVMALACISYAVFITSSLKLFPFSFFEILTITFIFLILNIYIAKKINLIKLVKQNLKLIVFEELLFFAGLACWAFVRGNLPDINGLEKFMDFGFINSILRSTYFPPLDMWYPPLPINYYYFGHLVTAVIIKASNIPAFIGYNLMLATLFSLTFATVFSLVMNLFAHIKIGIKATFAGLLSATLVTFGGNLTTIYTFFKAYMPLDKPVPFWTLPFQLFNFPNDYWYPNATRFIEYTIHEFPMYSFVVSDLHGHVLDIPFVVLTIAILFSFFYRFGGHQTFSQIIFKLGKIIINFEFLFFIFIGFLIAVMYMTNAWDGLIYFLLTVFILIFLFRKKGLLNIIYKIGVVFFSFVIFSLPFSIHFKPFASGIGVLCAPELLTSLGKIGPFLFEAQHCQRSPVWQLMVLYGFFYFFVIFFIIFLRVNKGKIYLADKFVSLLIILSTILLIIPEFIYLKDIYPAHYRANTMFKLSYEAFIMLSVSCGYIVFRILTNLKTKREIILFFIPSFILIYMVLSYSIFAINSFYADFRKYQGLDGLAYLEKTHPQDYQIIKWLGKNVKGQPIILEANGDSYTDYARISANTGLPTVVGWPVHEWLWRGTYDVVAPRIKDVETIYITEDLNVTKNLIKKYNISYVVVSQLEKEKYPSLKEEKFKKLGEIVFNFGGSKLYKVSF